MKKGLVLALLLIPSVVFGAGFAKQSLFLSQATVTQGETVFIYAVVENDSPSYFTGTLKFADESGAIGNASVSMKPGEAATYSTAWKPKAGQHSVSANLVNTSGDVVESENATFFVNSVPSPASPPGENVSIAFTNNASSSNATLNASSTIQTSQPLENWLASSSPIVSKYVTPVLTAIDSGRTAASHVITQGTQWSKDTLKHAATAPGGWQNTLWLILATLGLYTFAALSYLINNIGVFYPAFAIIFFFILWRAYRLVRRR
jgi:hypothetical protein